LKFRVATSTLVAGQLQSTWDPTFPVSQTNQYDNHKNPDNVKKPRLSLSVVTMLAFSMKGVACVESAALGAKAQTPQAGNIENKTRALRQTQAATAP